MADEVRYTTTSDGVRIAYTVSGEGPPLVLVPFIFTSFSLMHELPWYNDFLQRISQGRTLIRFDQRGTGLSQRDVDDARQITFENDTIAVLDALRIERASVLAGGPNGPQAITFAARRPEKVAALVLAGTSARSGDAAVASWAVIQGLATASRSNWEAAARALAGFNVRRTPEEATKLASIYVRSASADFIANHVEQNADLDLTALLRDITARTLIIHAEQDALYPFSVGQELAAQIPNARLLPLAGNLSLSTLGDKTEMVTDAINAFLDEDPETRRLAVSTEEALHPVATAPAIASGTAIILFADIVDSTALTERLGDAAFREKARALDTSLREIIRQRAGTPIEGKLLGDGVLAVFTSARQAIEAALACATAGDAALPLHLGLHAGDVIREDNNVYGGAVNIASRISGLSAPGEVLVSRTVADLARTSAGVTFEDRGEQSLKGIEEPVRVYEVRRQD